MGKRLFLGFMLATCCWIQSCSDKQQDEGNNDSPGTKEENPDSGNGLKLHEFEVGKWNKVSSTDAPTPRSQMSAFSTKHGVVLFSGYSNDGYRKDGGIFHPDTNSWEKIPPYDDLPESYSIDFAGESLIIWGGTKSNTLVNTGIQYHLKKREWLPLSVENAPPARYLTKTKTWNNQFVVWGGHPYCDKTDGGIYDPEKDHWTPIPKAPSSIVAGCENWLISNDQLIVWGGYNENDENTFSGFATFNLKTLSWQEIPANLPNSPSPRIWPLMAAKDGKLVIWGGMDASYDGIPDGAIFDFNKNKWSHLSANQAVVPLKDPMHTWLSSDQLFIWGGLNRIYWSNAENSELGAVLNLTTGAFSELNFDNAPELRSHALLTSRNNDAIIWGGDSCKTDGSIFHPSDNSWMTLPEPPFTRTSSATIWTDQALFVWGGSHCDWNTKEFYSDGYILFPQFGH